MFESAELGHVVDKATYKAEVPTVRERLLDAQYELLDKKRFPLVIVIAGVDGGGKGETVNELNTWMDARHVTTHALDAPTDVERERPAMWRFWRELPPKGKTAIFFGSWYASPIDARVAGDIEEGDLDAATEEIKRFERMLAGEGALILKFWFHLSKQQQKKRFNKLERRASTRWRVTSSEWASAHCYDRQRAVAERVLRQTSTAEAPWIVVEGADKRYRQLTVAKSILAALERRNALPDPPSVSAHVT
ncbi:MAG TPA: polyphosphate:AMP phosphotransferase, partial [Polyangia bacterium]|nr:polyphosphate:AMP phosphotransferase [Polyangia bacterium]